MNNKKINEKTTYETRPGKMSWLQLCSLFERFSKSNPEIPTTIKTMGVSITNIAEP